MGIVRHYEGCSPAAGSAAKCGSKLHMHVWRRPDPDFYHSREAPDFMTGLVRQFQMLETYLEEECANREGLVFFSPEKCKCLSVQVRVFFTR